MDLLLASKLGKPGEIWLGLPDFPDYLVGVHGAVMSMKGGKAKILRPIKMGQYRGLQLADRQGVLRKRYLHRLVAEAVHGPCPDGMECCHNDGCRDNNDYSNLRWDTRTANEQDKGYRITNSRLSPETVKAMRLMREQTGAPYSKIAEQFGVSLTTAHKAVTGRSWKLEMLK